MLTKVVVGIALLLLVGKIFFRKQLRGLGKQIDRLVNYTLVALFITYALRALLDL